jgi:hypothetical protein
VEVRGAISALGRFRSLPGRFLGWLRRVGGLRPTVVAFAVAAIVGVAYWLFRKYALHQDSSWKTQVVPDASTLVSMFITLYALFLGGFAGLVGFVIKESPRRYRFWKVLAVWLLFGATLVDLWRILDATGDLYRSGIDGLKENQVRDDIADFTWFFFVNVAVIAFAIATACLPSRRPLRRQIRRRLVR